LLIIINFNHQTVYNGGWDLVSVCGHDFKQLYKALRNYYYSNSNKPHCIISETIMCKDLEGYEDNYNYHGAVLKPDQYKEAIRTSNIEPDLMNNYLDIEKNKVLIERKNFADRYNAIIKNRKYKIKNIEEKIKTSFKKEYYTGQMVSKRDAFGDALVQIGKDNISYNNKLPIMVFDCDLKGSVKTDKFEKIFPDNFIQAGIAEHNAAVVAEAVSRNYLLTFFVDFGVFGIDEVYNQLRLNDHDNASIKLVCTHTGVEVGEDGKSHHCIDYISLISNLFNFKIVIPADANHTVHITNYISSNPGSFLLVLNRSKIPVLGNEGGEPFYGKNFKFDYGKYDWLRKGNDGTIITYGHMTFRALKASEILLDKYNLKIGVLNVSSLPTLDKEKLYYAIENTKNIIVYEDHNINTGLGTIIGSFIAENKLNCNFKKMGV